MTLLDDDAAAAALRHGRWQIVLFIAALVVCLAIMLAHPGLFQLEQGEEAEVSELHATLRPWSIVAVGAMTVWALVLPALAARHRHAIATEPAARRSFRTVSTTLIVLPVLPGWLLWGPAGLGAAAIGLVCLVAPSVLARARNTQ
ncbi:hypothetical protein [Aeromicrobium wangtongii]|uniref:hypothetical protein n=1 Tax=Aeromicrobium wangtongii TaxID=2969247 RepID=UPI002016D5B9|nr:hypothetical protein [Aeromicrobium wangtongii]MCL3817961.1 hypothetical protein [Aeromicrobium wangtongii]